jgi:hypothetical protein
MKAMKTLIFTLTATAILFSCSDDPILTCTEKVLGEGQWKAQGENVYFDFSESTDTVSITTNSSTTRNRYYFSEDCDSLHIEPYADYSVYSYSESEVILRSLFMSDTVDLVLIPQ